MNIGFDFGTTNSIISYYDQERQALECFRPHAGANPYIPTAILYGRTIEIGESARAETGSDKVYSHFKLRLGMKFDEQIPGKEKSAHEVARDYIQALFQLMKNNGVTPERIVMTIPEAWYRERDNFMARENLMLMYRKELQMENVQFQSEPVAAAAYYCWKYQHQNEKNAQQTPYEGLLLIIDFGGGTLDVTLCEAQTSKIRILESCGFGGEDGRHGCAGSAFDREVVKRICKENEMEVNESTFLLACDEFERKLISKTEACTELLQDYFEYPEGVEDEVLFVLDFLQRTPVKCRHLKEAFSEVNEPVLERAIRQIQAASDMDLSKIRVVMVGGFSNFCCTEEVVRRLFSSKMGMEDPRFDNLLSRENKALAIAKGAALIADGKIAVDPVFPYELGMVLGERDENNIYRDCFVPLIHKRERIDKYSHPVYWEERIELRTEFAAASYARLYTGEEGEREIFALDESIRDVFPIQDDVRNEFQIGLAVDASMIPELCIRNINGGENSERRTYLNKVLERLLLRRKQAE